MEQKEFEEYIEYLQNKKFKTSRPASMIKNNFYSLVTIIMMSIVILLYSNYILPAIEDYNKTHKITYETNTTTNSH